MLSGDSMLSPASKPAPLMNTRVSFSETPPNIYKYHENLIISSEEDLATTADDTLNDSNEPHDQYTNNDSQELIHFKTPDYVHPHPQHCDEQQLLALPQFNSRPLNDTPVVSTVSSPLQDPSSPPLSDEEELSNSSDEDKNLNIAKQNKEKNKDIPLLNLNGAKIEPADAAASILMRSSKKKGHLEQHLLLRALHLHPLHHPVATILDIPGQTRSKASPDGQILKSEVGSKLVIVMVGLPLRGKSYITNKLTRYLNWLQHGTQVFNVGNTRRRVNSELGPEKNPLPDSPLHQDSGNPSPDSSSMAVTSTMHKLSFFSPDNKLTTLLREKWAMDTLDELLNNVIDGDLSVGIFDLTNSTKLRRAKLLKRILERSNGELKVLFLESICSDPLIIDQNVRLKLSGPDYKDIDPAIALEDFHGRLRNYEKLYETIGDDEEKIKDFSYIKMIDVGKKVVSFNVQGYLLAQTVYFLLNFNLLERQIWITRHGESHDNVLGRIGGDLPLTERGIRYSKLLLRFMQFKKREFREQQLHRYEENCKQKEADKEATTGPSCPPEEPLFTVWTSMLQRAVQTLQYFSEEEFFVKEMRMLNELGAGKCDGMTYPEIQQKFPLDYRARIKNKMTYRYPGVGGESYLDVINRLRPVITEIERCTNHVLIVTHRVISRVLLGYFMNLDKSMVGELDIPLHTLYCLEPKPYGVEYKMYQYDEHSDWFNEVKIDELRNMKKVQQVDISFKERQYSVVPTAPSGQVFKKAYPYMDARSSRSSQIPGNNLSLEMEKLHEKLKNLHFSRAGDLP